MNRAITISIFVIILLIVGYCALHKNGFAPVKDRTKQLRDSISNLKKIILFSEFKESKLSDSVELKDKALRASELQVINIEAAHSRRIAYLQRVNQSKIDSLFYAFYPDSSKRAIVITHEEAAECDSVRTMLKQQNALHEQKENAQAAELQEIKEVQIPAWQKIDTTHRQLEMNLTDQLKAAKAKRFFVGPSLSIGFDGKVVPGISVGYALIKF